MKNIVCLNAKFQRIHVHLIEFEKCIIHTFDGFVCSCSKRIMHTFQFFMCIYEFWLLYHAYFLRFSLHLIDLPIQRTQCNTITNIKIYSTQLKKTKILTWLLHWERYLRKSPHLIPQLTASMLYSLDVYVK